MKKFIALALGSVLIGASIVAFSDASRDAYHAYLYQQALKNRSERRFSNAQRVRATYTQETGERSESPTLRNLMYPQNKRNLFGASETENTDLKVRPMSDAVVFSSANTTSRQTLTVTNLDPMHIVVKTIATDDFSVEIPRNWNYRMEENVLHTGGENTFKITIRRIEDACKDTLGFQSCAINLSNNLNRLDNIDQRITNLGHVARLRQDTDRILGTNDYVKTHMESFLGTYLGNDVFIARYFVEEEGTDNVFLLESIAQRSFASEAVIVMKRLTNSFRMIRR